MITYAVYYTASRLLASIGTTLDELPDGLDFKTYHRPIDLAVEQWNPATLDFEAIPPRTTTKISRQAFMDRLGDDVVTDIQEASFQNTRLGATLRTWLLRYQVVTDIDVADPRTIGGVDALIAAGFIPEHKRAAILAPETGL